MIADISSANVEIEKRNLSLTEPLDSNKYFNEVRNTDLVINQSTYNIQDITSTEYIFVDSINKVKRACDDVCKIKGVTVDETLMFLLKWNKYTNEQKNKKYNDYQCHEVNLFLYFKDNEYFNKVARPFIASKMEKTFIDHWLLGEDDAIMHYQDIGYFDKLNALEQSLLVSTIVKYDTDKATKLSERIRLGSESNEKMMTAEVKNKLFDTVLSLNLLQKDTQKIELLQKVKQNENELQGNCFCLHPYSFMFLLTCFILKIIFTYYFMSKYKKINKGLYFTFRLYIFLTDNSVLYIIIS